MDTAKPNNRAGALPPDYQEALDKWIIGEKFICEDGDAVSYAVGESAVEKYSQCYKSTYIETYKQTLKRLARMSRVSLPDYLELTGLEFGKMEVIDDFVGWSRAYADLISCLDLQLQEIADRRTKEYMDRSFPDFESWLKGHPD